MGIALLLRAPALEAESPNAQVLEHSVEEGQPMEILKEFTIEAAHRLPNLPAGHKCGRLHWHSFRVEIHVRGSVVDSVGWVMDFAEIKKACTAILGMTAQSILRAILCQKSESKILIWNTVFASRSVREVWS